MSQALKTPAATRQPKPLAYTQKASRSTPIWVWVAIAAAVLLLGVGIALFAQGSAQPPLGKLSADTTSYPFGQIKLNGGNVTTQFPLKVDSDTLVTGLTSTCMCTKARLIQGGKVSNWFSMDHGGGPVPSPNWTLKPNEPAFLEVNVDPAAHGEAGLGPMERAVILRTASGQALQFTVTAEIVR